MPDATVAILRWTELDAARREQVLARPALPEAENFHANVRHIVASVRREGDVALLRLTRELDCAVMTEFEVTPAEFVDAEAVITPMQRAALECAIANVRRFHEAQKAPPLAVETSPGVYCERREVPIAAVGLYVPSGSAPLPSTAIMLAVPAAIAGCNTRIVCTPPRSDGTADPAVLVAARLCGVQRVFKIGGAQAIAAMAFGTHSVPKVDKVFGPGNPWVTAAKELVAAMPDGAARDLPAGPSEVLVIADESANPQFVAADLLAQAEHSVDAQVLLLTTSPALACATQAQLADQRTPLVRRSIIEQSLLAARIVLVDSLEEAVAISNRYGPEHLILAVAEPRLWLAKVRSAGSIFIGHFTPETMGDYCSGTNHVLPTGGHARVLSGLSLADFSKRITVQEISASGLRDLGPVAETLARLEGLDAHANAVSVRLRALAAVAAT
ncbi:MAG: histidinol dehydrogenase [Steroidobacteraceae bacterium]